MFFPLSFLLMKECCGAHKNNISSFKLSFYAFLKVEIKLNGPGTYLL